MSKKLNIQLNQKYKSFNLNFNQEFIGDLIILSGVNGSGKTQLIDIIKGYSKPNDPVPKINRTITQEGVVLNETLIAHKSFRDYSTITDLTIAQVGNLFEARNTIFSWYQSYRLDFNHPNANGYKDVIKRAKNLLIEKFGQEKFDAGTISREELKDAIPHDFILFQDDIFTNKIGEIFFTYVSLVHNKKAEAGENNISFDSTALPVAPWTELNNLFEKLNFAYRFKSSYKRVDDEIDEQPAIYPVKDDGTIVLTEKRALTDLSDGEKALISLTFAVLASGQTHPKLLLLDEYDATLNPSLTNAFFTILDEFFVKKDVQVIVVTHSSSTLSLAPEGASFYEVYRAKDDRPRVLQVQRDQYEELAIANKKFYVKIEDQDARYLEVQEENKTLKDVIQRLQRANPKLQIITEGKNVEHIKIALNIIDHTLLEKVDVVSGAESKSGKQQLKNAFEILSHIVGAPKTLFVWDCDALPIVSALIETASAFKYCFPQNQNNTKTKTGIENLYPEDMFTDDQYIIEEEMRDNGTSITTKSVDKNKFLEKVKAINQTVIFENYNPLIEKIKSLLST